MKTLSLTAFEEVRRWLYRNARPLELARWQYHFEDGSAENVLRALAAFQNEDGGFGHALDGDNWNPNSTPYNAGIAIEVYRELNLYDPSHPLVEKTLAYLTHTEFLTEKGWPFTIPSNSDYPHAPWWTYSEQNNEENGYHATGGLVGFILRCGDKGSGLYSKALGIADGMMEKLREQDKLEQHEIGAYCTLLKDIQAAELTDRFESEWLAKRLHALVNEAIERDPAKWPSYSMRPTMYIDSPNSPFYPGNEALVEEELSYLLRSRREGAVWAIMWTWADCEREFAISERWWQGYWAVRNVLLLKAFHRLS
ncbi:hypothetical protein [Gorillibacterium sp. CAU 1737]|uniref:hypothetical protein n=1 Tax=Gorillibacterium sp. CAU 1737 TaxID=3140362 RepID=UPI0032601C6A